MKREVRIVAWNAHIPVYATPELLDWRSRAAAARAALEREPEDDGLRAAYFEVLGERGGR